MKKPTNQIPRTIEKEDILLKAIPLGKKNARTNRDIASLLPFKISEAKFRGYIHNLREKGAHILSNSALGYWRATGSSKNQKQQYMKFWNKHANSIKSIVATEKKKTPTKTQLKKFIASHPTFKKQQVAEHFGVSRSTVYRILHSKNKRNKKRAKGNR